MNSIDQTKFENIKTRIEAAVHLLYKNDHFLITNASNERSITHKLAEYIQDLFPEWHVDCEYNRLGEGLPKSLQQQETSYPDIIIHIRNIKNNLLIIEAKSVHAQNHNDEADKEKIKSYMEDERYAYRYGLWICFYDEPSDVPLDWYINQNGECIPIGDKV